MPLFGMCATKALRPSGAGKADFRFPGGLGVFAGSQTKPGSSAEFVRFKLCGCCFEIHIVPEATGRLQKTARENEPLHTRHQDES